MIARIGGRITFHLQRIFSQAYQHTRLTFCPPASSPIMQVLKKRRASDGRKFSMTKICGDASEAKVWPVAGMSTKRWLSWRNCSSDRRASSVGSVLASNPAPVSNCSQNKTQMMIPLGTSVKFATGKTTLISKFPSLMLECSLCFHKEILNHFYLSLVLILQAEFLKVIFLTTKFKTLARY
jgi:hypothetical protein